MKLLHRYYCTAIDYLVAIFIAFAISAVFYNNFKIDLELIAYFIFIFILTSMQFYNFSALGIIYKNQLVKSDGGKINFIFLYFRNLIKSLLIVLFIFTSPISMIVYPFHMRWSEIKETLIDGIFKTKVVKMAKIE
jgi:hypothetical protein